MSGIHQALLMGGAVAAAPVTACLLHFDGTGSTFTDDSGKTCTAFGTATQSATQSVYGGKSLDLSGGAGRVEVANSTDFDFGTGAFLIEFRERRTANTGFQNLFSRGYGSAGGIFLQSTTSGSSFRTLYFVDGTNTSQAVIGSIAGPSGGLNTWLAWAIQRDASGVIRIFHDGLQVAQSMSGTYNQLSLGLSAPFVIGADNASSFWHRGYIDEFRVKKGVSPYSGSGYTVTGPFTYP